MLFLVAVLDGIEGVEYKSINISNSSPYTVPTNKTLYLISRQTNLYLNGNGRVVEYDHFFPIPVGEGKILSLNSGSIEGYLIDKGFEVKNYLGGDSIYIVPNDMYFYVLHSDSYINVDGNASVSGTTNYPSGTSSARTPLVFQPGSSITSPYGISGLLIPTDYCNQGSSSSSTIDSSYSLNDTVYSGSLSFGAGSSPQSDTISLPYIKGKDIFITGDNLLCFYGCSGSLRIVDDSGFDITAKVIGSMDLACTQCPAGFSISSISQISSANENNTIQAIIRPYNLTTTNLYLFFDVYSNPSGSGGGTISFQY